MTAPSKTRTIKPVLVLSTGRCGSTMVSKMLNRHPDVLSISEFFAALGPTAFTAANPDGNGIWKLCVRQNAMMRALLRKGLMVSEYIYPFDRPGARFRPDNVPPISLMTLPHLTEQHDVLYDELETFVRSKPRMPLADHYRGLFEFLAKKFGRKVWVERSGCSLMSTARLLRLFPEARVIHVYRDGRDTAMSMSNHHVFRAGAACLRKFGINPQKRIGSDDTRAIQGTLEDFLFRCLDVEKLVEDAQLELVDFGAFWNDMIVAGHEVMKGLPPERLLNIKFEDVQTSPRAKIREMIRFIDPSLENEAWLDEVETIPRSARSRFTELPQDVRDAVTHACAPGLKLLGYSYELPGGVGSGCPFRQTADAITEIMQRTWQPRNADGSRARAFHDTTLACLRAELHVEPPFEASFRHGLFSERKRYPALVRFSSGLFADERQPDQRGMALKLNDVRGEFCEDAPLGQQDFILLNQPYFALRDADENLALFRKFDRKGPLTASKLMVPRFIFPGPLWRNIRWRYLKSMIDTYWTHLKRRDLSQYNYYSVTPYRLGGTEVKYQFRPAAEPLKAVGRTFQERLQSVLDQGPVTFDFFIQPRAGDHEPIDDGTITWKGPVVRVGRLEIHSQPVRSTVPLGDAISFNPWNCLRAHEPLGSLNAARRVAYRRSAELRGGDPFFPSTESCQTGIGSQYSNTEN